MPDDFRSVLLVLHDHHPEATALAEAARIWCESHGAAVVLSDGGTDPPADLDLAVSLGGDGTILRTVQLALRADVPVLGINLGRMGYLAEVEPSGLEDALERLWKGEYLVTERMVLEVDVETSEGSTHSLALNEAIVEKTVPGHTIRVAASVNGRPFLTYVADGLLACTPTGSTAYNLSARGPVLSPEMHAIVLTPVAPHLVFDRSLVLGGNESVEMRLEESAPAAAVIDGARVISLAAGDLVRCRAASQRARLVSFGHLDFHAVLRSRFGIASR